MTLQTPEEIEEWCTKEDLPEVRRCVHLLKKGYGKQKISVSHCLITMSPSQQANNKTIFPSKHVHLHLLGWRLDDATG